MLTLSAVVAHHACRRPDRTAVIYQGQRISYRELDRRCRRLAGLIASRGIAPGERVAVVMKNSAAFLEVALAVGHLGAVLVPVNFRLAPEEAAYILDDAGVRLLFVDAEFESGFADFGDRILVDAAAQADSSRLVPDGTPEPVAAAPGPEDLQRIVYTSGTTSRPKGVMLSYANLYWKSMSEVIELGLGGDDRLLVAGPLYHVAAFDLPGVAVLWTGGTLSILRDFSPEQVFAEITAGRLTGAWLAPVMLGALLADGNRGGHDLSSFRWCIGGGERTPEGRIRAFGDLFPTARYIDAYGLSETVGGDTMMEAGREIEKIGSTGRALLHVEIEIRDDDGRRLGPGEDGEICLRGPKVTRGYWRSPEATAAAFHPDGFFRSGDIGHLDAEGFLYLTDRKKDLIISGGENIASSEVERVLYELPAIADVAVIGLPDSRWGERPVAVAVLKPGASLEAAEMERHCRGRLAGFKVPKALILRESLPRNPSGKVLKRVLRDEFGAKQKDR